MQTMLRSPARPMVRMPSKMPSSAVVGFPIPKPSVAKAEHKDLTENKEPSLENKACLVIYRTEGLGENEVGRTYELPNPPAELVIGTHTRADIQVPPDPLFPYSVCIHQREPGQWWLQNLEVHNNVYVNQTLSRWCRLRDGDRIQVSSITFRFLDGQGDDSYFYQQLYRLIGTDALTGISNRRQLEDYLLRSMASCARNTQPFSLVMIDVDNFGLLNNTHGHAAGDQALRQLVDRIRKHLRAPDILGREGGEEFFLGLPNVSKAKAVDFVDRLRKRVTREPILYKKMPLTVTFSAGVATHMYSKENATHKVDFGQQLTVLKAEADQQMYEAKRQGKNRVIG